MANEENKQQGPGESESGQAKQDIAQQHTTDDGLTPASAGDGDSAAAAGEERNSDADTGEEQPEASGIAGAEESPDAMPDETDESKGKPEKEDTAKRETENAPDASRTAAPGAGSRQPPLGLEKDEPADAEAAGDDPAKGQPEPGPDNDPHRGAGDTLSQHEDLDPDAARSNDREGFSGTKPDGRGGDDTDAEK